MLKISSIIVILGLAVEMYSCSPLRSLVLPSAVKKPNGIPQNGDITGIFIHASTSNGVMVSPLKDNYWKPKYMGARRYL